MDDNSNLTDDDFLEQDALLTGGLRGPLSLTQQPGSNSASTLSWASGHQSASSLNEIELDFEPEEQYQPVVFERGPDMRGGGRGTRSARRLVAGMPPSTPQEISGLPSDVLSASSSLSHLSMDRMPSGSSTSLSVGPIREGHLLRAKEIWQSELTMMGDFEQSDLTLEHTNQQNPPSCDTVDAIVPKILIPQVLDSILGSISSIKRGRRRGSMFSVVGDETNGNPLSGANAIRNAVDDYRRTGSIQRYRGVLLFIDISGFTRLSQLYPVEDLKTFINGYFTVIIDTIVEYGGEVVKFAGDALYVLWSTERQTNGCVPDKEGPEVRQLRQSAAVARCIACGVAINLKCNGYRVAKSNRRRNSSEFSSQRRNSRTRRQSWSSNKSDDGLERDSYVRRRTSNGNVVRRLSWSGSSSLSADEHGVRDFEDFEAEEVYLNVKCGIGEGIMAGVDVIAGDRAEFFLIGQPLADVAAAEQKADKGELVLSPSVYDCVKDFVGLEGKDVLLFQKEFADLSADARSCVELIRDTLAPADFMALDEGFYKVMSEEYLYSSILSDSKEKSKQGARSMVRDRLSVAVPPTPTDFSSGSLRQVSLQRAEEDVIKLMESHSHESTRDVHEKVLAELRSVAVLFIKVLYEPKLVVGDPDGTSNEERRDEDILWHFQTIYNIIYDCLSRRNGQVRQFISDDKGTVCLASFGLRGSATLNVAATAVNAAQAIQKQLLQEFNTKCTIGITFGKSFCGETGSPSRYEFSLMGPSVNLSARLMAYGTVGTIKCDQQIERHDHDHVFICDEKHKLKGFTRPVLFYKPIDDALVAEGDKNKNHPQRDEPQILLRKEEIKEVVEYIKMIQREGFQEEGNGACGSPEDESDQRDSTVSNPKLRKPRAVLVSGQIGTGKSQVIHGVLNDPTVQVEMNVLEANGCYHNQPFFCWIPIVTKIIKRSEEVISTLAKMKTRPKRSILPALLFSVQSTAKPEEVSSESLVPDDLIPYLGLVNDFLYQGFRLFPKTKAAKSLKGKQKEDKVFEVLSAIIVQYVQQCKRTTIIALHNLEAVDSYSKRLIQRIFNCECKLLFIGSVRQASPRRASDVSHDTVDDGDKFLQTIFGCKHEDNRNKFVRLGRVSDDSVFELFKSSINSIMEEDRELLDRPEIVKKVHELCSGIPRYAVGFAQAVNIELSGTALSAASPIDRIAFVEQILQNFPLTKIEEVIFFRFDHLSSEAQMLLKIASAAGFDQYSFSFRLLETLMLDLEASVGGSTVAGETDTSTNVSPEFPNVNRLFRGNNFEQLVRSLIDQNFLMEIGMDMSDVTSSEGSQLFRFVNSLEQKTINGLMLDDQKKKLHLKIAEYYQNKLFFQADVDMEYCDFDPYDDSKSVSSLDSSFTEATVAVTENWQLLDLIAAHCELAELTDQAMSYYYGCAMKLSSLGLRDKSYGSLKSAHRMFEKRLRESRIVDTTALSDGVLERRRLATHILQMVCNHDLPSHMQTLTQEHLKWMFGDKQEDFVTAIKMLTKLSQSMSIFEEEEHKVFSEINLQVIFMSLLGSNQSVFDRMVADLQFLDPSKSPVAPPSSVQGDVFCLDNLACSLPAFSGMLTFYDDFSCQNDSNLRRETILASLSAVIAEDTNDTVHMLQQKWIQSHLYMKTGDIEKALEMSEAIKQSYTYGACSLSLEQLYGMDWPLINVATMTSVYIFSGRISSALQSVLFLEEKLVDIDESASRTKGMLKGMLSSIYLILQEFDIAAAYANGIAETLYENFSDPSGILVEGLTRKLQKLHSAIGLSSDMSNEDPFQHDCDVLAILMEEKSSHKRTILHQRSEVLGVRGMEATEAAICMAEIDWLEMSYKRGADAIKEGRSPDIVRKQMEYCLAGLAHLEQSLTQKDAKSHEKRTNYMCCLCQKAELLIWRNRLRSRQDENHATADSEHTDAARLLFLECQELCDMYTYPLMLLIVGAKQVTLLFDVSHGHELVSRALKWIEKSRSSEDYDHAVRVLQSLCD